MVVGVIFLLHNDENTIEWFNLCLYFKMKYRYNVDTGGK